MPDLPAPGGKLAKQRSTESVSSEGSKWVPKILTNISLNWMVFFILISKTQLYLCSIFEKGLTSLVDINENAAFSVDWGSKTPENPN